MTGAIWSGNSNNGTPVGGASQVTNGKMGKAFGFDGVNDYVDVGTTVNKYNDTATYSVWFKLNDNLTSQAIVGHDVNSGQVWTGTVCGHLWLSSGNLRTQLYDGSYLSVETAISTQRWYHAVYIINTTNPTGNLSLYLNGNYINSVSFNVPTFGFVGGNACDLNGIKIARQSTSTGFPFNGSIDDVMIFNRSLSADEIKSLYNATAYQHTEILSANANHTFTAYIQDFAGNVNNTGQVRFTLDTIFPTYNFSSPSETSGSYINRNNIVVNLSVNDTNFANRTIYLYNSSGSLNQSNFSTSNPSFVNYTGLSDGLWYFNATIFDLAGNFNNTETRNVTIDTTFSLIAYGTNMAVNKANLSQNWTFVNITLTEINLANLTYNIVNNTGTVNQTNYTSAILTINWTNLPDTNYSYWVNVTDLAGNKNSTPVRTITLDKTAPSGNLTAPVNATYLANGTSINFSANLSDNIGIANATLNVYNASNYLVNQTIIIGYVTGTISTSVGVVINLIEGIYNWFYQVFDFASNQFTTANNTLTVDLTYPIVNFVSPTPSNNSGRSGVFQINATINETNLGNVSINFNNTIEASCNRSSSSLNNAFSCSNANATVYNTSSTSWIFLFNRTGLAAGMVYYYNITVYDFALNQNKTETWLIRGNTAPAINFASSTTEAGNYSRNEIIANVTSTDGESNMNITEVYLFYRNIWSNNTLTLLNRTTMNNSASNPIYLNYSNLSEGIYYLNATAGDIVGETSNTSTRKIVLDRTNPNITLITPSNATITNNQTINLTANISENLGINNATLFVYNYSNYLVNQTAIVGYAEGTLTMLTGIVVNLIDNIYSWFYSVFDFAGNLFISVNNTLIVDIVYPAISGIIYSPNSTSVLDPSATIIFNATLTDSWAGVEKVVLEIHNSSRWVNYTMSRNSGNSLNGNYNASVILSAIDNNYTFYIWYNDSAGNYNQSVNQSFFAYWDCTWNISTTGTGMNLGTVGGYNQEKLLGNITLNNTGDVQYSNNNCSITFARTSTGSSWYTGSTGYEGDGEYLNFSAAYYLKSGTKGLRYYYNNSQLTSININVSETKILEVRGGFVRLATVLNEYPSFVIAASINDSQDSRNNATISARMTITPGAYLDVIIDNPSSNANVYLTPGNTNLTAYVQDLVSALDNINNTAYNVSFNWTIPSSITSLISGNLTANYSILNDTSKQYLNLTLSLTASNIAGLGQTTHNLSIYAQGYENSSGTLLFINTSGNLTIFSSSRTLTFLCYNTSDNVCVTACGNAQDPDCTVATTTTTVTTTSGGGGAGAQGGGSVAKSEATVELTRGKEQEFELEIKNKYPGAMKKIRISVSGINQEYITIIPNTIDSIDGYSSKKFKVKITAPAYFSGKKYTLYFDIVSKLESATGLTDLSERKVVTLYIFEFSREEADAFVNETEAFLEEMNASGLNVKGISKLLESINTNYADSNFLSIKDNYDKAKEIYDNALEANKLISDLTNEMKGAEARGISTIETKKMLYIAEAAFERGDYSLALERLKEARLTFALETKGEFNLAYAIKNNLLESFGILIGLGLFSVGSMLFVRFQIYKRKLRALKEEEILLLELMKIIQKECFERSNMSLEEYESAMSQYETRLSETVEERIKIETKVANMLKIKGRRIALDEEKKRLTLMVMKIQDDYLNKGKIETRIYENMIKSYTKRLSEVQEEIATMEAEEAVRRERSVRRMFVIEKGVK